MHAKRARAIHPDAPIAPKNKPDAIPGTPDPIRKSIHPPHISG
jgi:hypothetical protein